jgi:hypothetical protein
MEAPKYSQFSSAFGYHIFRKNLPYEENILYYVEIFLELCLEPLVTLITVYPVPK